MSHWYAAHIILYVKRKEKRSAKIPVWENIVLLKADSEDEAWEKARARGMADAGDDGGTFRWDGVPAEWVFAGVRKITLCDDSEKRPGDGTEVTYLEMEVESEKALRALVSGQSSEVKLNDFDENSDARNGSGDPVRNGMNSKAAKVTH